MAKMYVIINEENTFFSDEMFFSEELAKEKIEQVKLKYGKEAEVNLRVGEVVIK